MQYISAFRTKLLYLLFCSHGEALQAAGHVTQALLEGCHQVSLHRDTKTVFSFSHSQISRTSSHQACSEQFIWTGNLLEASYMTSLLHLRCELTIIHSLFSMKKKKKKKSQRWGKDVKTHRSRRFSHPDFLRHLRMQRRHAEECQMFGEVMPSAVYVYGCVCACVFRIYVYVWMSAEALCSWLCFLVQICKICVCVRLCVSVCVCVCILPAHPPSLARDPETPVRPGVSHRGGQRAQTDQTISAQHKYTHMHTHIHICIIILW